MTHPLKKAWRYSRHTERHGLVTRGATRGGLEDASRAECPTRTAAVLQGAKQICGDSIVRLFA